MKEFPVLAPEGERFPKHMMTGRFGWHTEEEAAIPHALRPPPTNMRLQSLSAHWRDGSVSMAWTGEGDHLWNVIENLSSMELQPWEQIPVHGDEQYGPGDIRQFVEVEGPREGSRLDITRHPRMGVTIVKLYVPGMRLESWRLIPGPYPMVPVRPNIVLLGDEADVAASGPEGEHCGEPDGEHDDEPED